MSIEWKALTVKCKESGKLINIKDYKFNADMHERIEEAKKEEEKPFVCEECGKAYKTEAALKGHMTKEHSQPKQ